MISKKKMVNVVWARLGQPAVEVSVEDKLSEFQRLVGGYIERIACLSDGFVYIVDEEGMAKGRPWNRAMFRGDFFVAKENRTRTKFTPMTETEVKEWVGRLT